MISLKLAQLLGVIVILHGSTAVLWPCITSNDCSKVQNATCSIYSYCQCPAGYVFSTDVSRCLKESSYGVACEEGVQCSHMLTGAKCDNGVCTCDAGYTYVKGRCRQLANLHDSCDIDLDCFFSYDREAVVCRKGSCECSEGYYERSTNVCRRTATKGGPCVVRADCVGENLSCVRDKCTETSPARKLVKDVGIQTQEPNGILHSKDTWPYHSLDSSTREESTQFGDTCTGDGTECPGLPYSVCRQGLCNCQKGYYEDNKICKAELGEFIHSPEYCKAGVFRDGRCLCNYNLFYGYNMRSCIKSVLGIGTSCTANSQCSPYGAAYCTSITPKRCTCYEYATYDEKQELCVPKKGLEEFCETGEDCTIPNTQCTPQNTCVCKPNHIFKEGICKPGKGGSCETVDDCGFDLATCSDVEEIKRTNDVEKSDKECQCDKGYVYHDNTCLPQAERYEDACIEAEQCKPLLGELASCIDNKCQCDDARTHYKDEKCNSKVRLNEKCSTSSECFVTDNPHKAECRNGICQCDFDSSPDIEQQKCVQPKSGKNSSGRPSAFKVFTLLLTTAAVLITGSALKQAYYP